MPFLVGEIFWGATSGWHDKKTVTNDEFSRSPNIGSTLGYTFRTLSALAAIELQLSIIFYSLICSQPKDKQNRARDFRLFKYFLNNLFSTAFRQNRLSKLVVRKNADNVLCSSLLEMCAQKFKVDFASRFCTGVRQVFKNQKPLTTGIPLTMKTVTSNSL